MARHSGGRLRIPGLLTVVVAAHGPADHVDQCLCSLRVQAHRRCEVLVVDLGGDDRTAAVVAGHVAEDRRVRLLPGSVASVGVARARGAAAAAGTFLAFVDAEDTITAHGLLAATRSLARSGSSYALLGHRVQRRGQVFEPDEWVRHVHATPAIGTGPAESPRLLGDHLLGAAVFRRAWFDRQLGHRPELLGDDTVLLATSAARATGIDLLAVVGLLHRADIDRTGPGRLGLDSPGVRALAQSVTEAVARLGEVNPTSGALRAGYALARQLPPWIDHLWYSDDAYWRAVHQVVAGLSPLAGEAGMQVVPAYQKTLHHLVLTEDLATVRAFLADVRPDPRRHPTTVLDDHCVVVDHGARWSSVPEECRRLGGPELDLRAELRTVHLDGDRIELRGWAYLDNVDPDGPPEVELALVRADGTRVPLVTVGAEEPAADQHSGLHVADVTPAGFVARLPLADLPGGTGTWRLRASVRCRGLSAHGPVTVRPWVMAGMPPWQDAAGRRLHVDHDDLAMAHLEVRAPDLVASTLFDGDVLRVAVEGADAHRSTLQPLSDARTCQPVASRRVANRLESDFRLDAIDPTTDYALVVHGAGGRRHQSEVIGLPTDEPAAVVTRSGRRGGLLVRAPARAATATAVRLDHEVLVVDLLLGSAPGWRAALTVGTDELPDTVQALPAGRVQARLPLVRNDWGRRDVCLPAGEYVVSVTNDRLAGWVPVMPADDLAADGLPLEELQGRMRLRAECFYPDRPGVRVSVGSPLADDEIGARHQRLLRDTSATEVADRDSVFIRAMFGEHASGNGLGVHQELVRRGSSMELLWSVADRSVAVPPSGTGVLERSRAWHEAIARSRYHLVDVHQVEWFARPREQVLIQTMHGYPWKVMGHAWWRKMGNPVDEIGSLDRRTRDWSVFVSPASYATSLLREAFLEPAGARVPLLESGYPRNDALLRPERTEVRARTRALLGIAEGQVAVLYAPTFRDYLSAEDRTARTVRFFDVDEALATLPDHYVVLRRGHAFSARIRSDRVRQTDRFIDVTDYPDVNDLILASDVAVLDYSSLRFDYVLSGNPMVFLVPDLDEYSRHRGGVLPYAPTAPGPFTSTTAETVAWLVDLDRLTKEHTAARKRFRSEYVDLEDGHSAARIVDAVFTPRGDG